MFANKVMFRGLIGLGALACLVFFGQTPLEAGITLGNSATNRSSVDGWRSILLVNESDTYTNTSGVAETIQVEQFDFYVKRYAARVTPFVVQVHGNNNFTVRAVGDTRHSGSDYTSTGSWSFPFGGSSSFILQDGQKIAPGYLDANADGSGSNHAVIAYSNGGDEIWITGGGGSGDSGAVVVDQPPILGSTTYNGHRDYSFNLEMDAIRAPSESDWEHNKAFREDPRPLEVYRMPERPTIDGQLAVSEWTGATVYESLDPTGDPQGTLYAGIADGYLAVANDWTVNDDPNPVLGGRNAWRFGTALGSGPGSAGSGSWYEVLVQDADPLDEVWVREAALEADLQNQPWQPGSDFGIEAGAFYNGTNWQYELLMGETNPGPGPLPLCWHWVWQQIDPRPGDGFWLPVYDGSVHHAPEPATLLIWSLLAGLGIGLRWRRRRA